MRIAFFGLGHMGAPLARNLHDDGHDLVAWNRDPARAQPLRQAGAHVAATVGEAAHGAAIAITMLADDAAERAISLGGDGLVAHLPSGAIRVCMSTIGVGASRELARAHAEAGQHYVAAPVFGRPPAVVARTLWIAAAGPAAAMDVVKPLLAALARGITFAGDDAPRAHALKLGANALGAVMLEGLAESLALGEKAGMPSTDYLALLDAAMFQTNFVGNYGRMVVSGADDRDGGFPLRLGLKDISLAMAAALELAAPLPLASQVRERMLRACATGSAEADLPRLADLAFVDAGLTPPA
ncbi:MAG TPA: NAD(P)-dependent oxidoreductase [Rhodanobacteraceae bacterium]|nr:NAD(P)-dependent oxidoreductase [Rhodanobacteraceae bacterium]